MGDCSINIIMNHSSKCFNQFYQEQNIQFRKEIRQLDLANAYKTPAETDYNKLDYNFAVVGPNGSGKTSLLKTMHFALNAAMPPPFEVVEMGKIALKKMQIKKGKRYIVEGLSKVKETDRKRVVTGYEFEGKDSHNHSIQYKTVLEFIDNKSINCSGKQSYFAPNKMQTNVKLCIFCIDLFQELSFEESNNIKFLKADLQEKGIKSLVVLTHIDKLSKMKEMQKEADRIDFIDFRVGDICKDLDIKDREDIICVENYPFDQDKNSKNLINGHKIGLSNLGSTISSSSLISQTVQNNQEINFYSLKLLLRILKEIDQYNKNMKPTKFFKGWFCGCN